jgi:hypothetical protein
MEVAKPRAMAGVTAARRAAAIAERCKNMIVDGSRGRKLVVRVKERFGFGSFEGFADGLICDVGWVLGPPLSGGNWPIAGCGLQTRD